MTVKTERQSETDPITSLQATVSNNTVFFILLPIVSAHPDEHYYTLTKGNNKVLLKCTSNSVPQLTTF